MTRDDPYSTVLAIAFASCGLLSGWIYGRLDGLWAALMGLFAAFVLGAMYERRRKKD